jgi:hypothetical protein
LPEAGGGIKEGERDERGGGDAKEIAEADVAPMRSSAAVEPHGNPDGEFDDQDGGEEAEEELRGPIVSDGEVESDGQGEEESHGEEGGLERERGGGVSSGLPWPMVVRVEGWRYGSQHE